MPHPAAEPVAVDLLNGRLRCGAEIVALRPRDAAVLRQLLDRPGQLVTKDALIAAVWRGVAVTDASLKASINRLRAVLGDNPAEPRFIQTVHRVGYRFVGSLPVVDAGSLGVPPGLIPPVAPAGSSPGTQAVVGRGAEIARLDRVLSEAIGGVCQVAFISGEAGLGKSALLDLFLATRVPAGSIVGRGQCVEQYGAGEAFMPLCESLRAMCGGADGAAVLGRLVDHAPGWVMQVPGLVTGAAGEAIAGRAAGATRGRLLREFAAGLAAVARDRLVVVAIEDLHWSDASTLDALALLARQRDAARLLVIATYRPEEALSREHALLPFVRDLRLHRLSTEVPLAPLDAAAVAAFLEVRFPGCGLPGPVARAVHARTEGHPLFLQALADHWVASGWVSRGASGWQLHTDPGGLATNVPADFAQIVDARLDRLDRAERLLVQAASVSGPAFAAASVAAALDEETPAVDERCAAIARRRLLFRIEGEEVWPDGTSSGRYRFAHALYRELTYDQVPASRRQQMHRRIAAREEASYGPQAPSIAARLAMHAEAAHDDDAAIRHRIAAAQNVIGVGGFREAIVHATAGLAAISKRGRGGGHHAREGQELTLQLHLGASLAAVEGFASSAAGRAYARALELSGHVPDPAAVQGLAGLYAYHLMRGPVSVTGEIAARLCTVAIEAGDEESVAWSRMAMGVQCLQAGDLLGARQALEAVLSGEPARAGRSRAVHAVDAAVASLGYLSWTLWTLGEPAAACERGQAALELANRSGYPVDVTHALVLQAHLHQFQDQAASAGTCAARAIALSEEYGLGQYLGPAHIMHGWSLAAAGSADGVEVLRRAIDEWTATGARYAQPRHFALLGGVLLAAGDLSGTEAALNRGISMAAESGERFWEPELYRLRAEACLARAAGPRGGERTTLVAAAREAVDRALDLARAQSARALEQRARQTRDRIGA